MKRCSKCGKTAVDGAYCESCGSLLEEEQVTGSSRLKSSIGRGAVREVPAHPMGEPPAPPTEDPEQEKGSPSRLKGSLGQGGRTARVLPMVGEDGNTVQFKRSPRLRRELPEGTVEIAAPPSAGSKPEINWLATFLPMAVTVGIAVVMSMFLGGPMMMLYTLPMTVAGGIVSVTNYRRQTKKYNEQVKLRKEKYDQHIRNAVEDIESKRKEQHSAMVLSDPETLECVRIAQERRPRLWERRPTDPDFVSVRVGRGTVDFSVEISIPKDGLSLEEDTLEALPRQIREKYRRLEDAPIVFDLRRRQICGVVGTREQAKALIRNMVVQLAAHHCYTELKMVFVLNPADREMQWVRQLPHAQDSERMGCYVAASREEARQLFQGFCEGLKRRKAQDSTQGTYGAADAAAVLPYCLFVILEPAFLDKSDPINEYLFRSRNLGTGCIMAVQDIAQLPKECQDLLVLRERGGEMFHTINAASKQAFQVDQFPWEGAETFARALRDLRCDEEVTRESLPDAYSFYEMLGISRIADYDIGRHWAESNSRQSLAVPIGINEGGRVLSLDLHEKGHGPHGLVAGATRSGKSELLQTYILSMALHYHPYEVGFLLIDFKGGGLSNQFAELPHLLGSITNISTEEINRSLASIKAELVKRQQLFAKLGVNTIEKYLEKYRAGKAETPLPHLIIIVDEFAELKAEQPEFMKELVSAARIGGSLGVHLILATQKPAGQVNEQIWSNSRFQICLRVASESDSNEVIKSPLAASLTLPGRAYLRVGSNEIFELFQSAYSGGPAEGETSVFDVCLHRVEEYCREQGIRKLPDICLPALQERIPYPRQLPPEGRLSLGIYDDPAEQYQGDYRLNFREKNAFAVGSSLSGKTNLLQCLIRGIADRYSPEEVQIYVLDFAAGVLKIFEELHHVGGVVTPLEDEKLKNLFKLLNAEIEERGKRFLELGVSSFSAYREAGRKGLPQILLLVDNLSSLKDRCFQEEDPLLPICQKGLTYGISVFAVNGQTAGLGYQYLPNFSTKLAFYCNDAGEYSTVFDRCTLRIPDTPGRCIVEEGKKLCACQIYQAFPGEREIDRAENIRNYIAMVNAREPGTARSIPVVPEELRAEELFLRYREQMCTPGSFVVGLDYRDVGPVVLDLRTLGVMALSGREPRQTLRLLRSLICAAGRKGQGDTVFYIADDLGRGLEDLRSHPAVSEYTNFPEKGIALAQAVEERLAQRYQALLNGEADGVLQPVLVLVLNGMDVIETVGRDAAAASALQNILGKYKNLGVCVLLSECENAPIAYSAPEVLKKVREEKRMICFEEIGSIKLTDVSFSVQRNYRKPLTPGDCYYFSGGDCRKIKVVLTDPA